MKQRSIILPSRFVLVPYLYKSDDSVSTKLIGAYSKGSRKAQCWVEARHLNSWKSESMQLLQARNGIYRKEKKGKEKGKEDQTSAHICNPVLVLRLFQELLTETLYLRHAELILSN